MKQSTPEISYEAKEFEGGRTNHGLVVTAYEKAREVGLFDLIGRRVKIRMRTKDYSPLDKLKTLWTSIVLGCEHTKEINQKLGAHEPDLASLLDLGTSRFPDQSGVNILLRRCTQANVAQMRETAFDLVCSHSRAGQRSLWLRLPGGRRVLVVDLDQRGLVVSGKDYELAEGGFYGRKRGRRGYQLTVAFLGGALREVFDEYFDPGKTPAGHRVADVLERLAQFCSRLGIAKEDVLVRADAQYGTPSIISRIQEAGFGFLIKGISPKHARSLEKQVSAQAVFERASASTSEARWVTDLGLVEHVATPVTKTSARIRVRTVFGVWVHEAPEKGPRPGAASRAKRAREGRVRPRVASCEYWLTSLEAQDLPAPEAVALYNARQTIEAYFKDEQQALGARHLRTHAAGGSAVFLWLVAITNNLLRWMQAETFAGTVVEQLGLKRLAKEVMTIPARLAREGTTLVVTLDRRFPLVRRLLEQWKPLRRANTASYLPPPLLLSS